MAPITRGNVSLLPEAGGFLKTSQGFREGSLDLADSEGRFERSREPSEEPTSYDEADMMYGDEDDDAGSEKQAQLEGPDDHEDILHPLREAANRVGREVERFAEVLDGYNPLRATDRTERHEMTTDLIDLYHGIALNTLDRLRDQHASDRRRKDGAKWRKKMRGFKITHNQDEIETEDLDGNGNPILESQTILQDLERWEQEAQTWDLLRRLVKLQLPPPGTDESALKAISRVRPLHQYSSEREVWETFLQSNEVALERKTVLQWLRDTAEESGEDINVLVQELQQNAERGDIIAHGWLHTKAAIKNQKRIHAWPQVLDPASPDVQRAHLNSSKTEPLVTQLDPDSTTRQGRKLETQDEYFERAIWLGCYEMLRRGKKATQVKEWCMERTEVWRAVSMSGLPDQESGDNEGTNNPASRALWRRMCFTLARKGGGDEYERAVYGILSGDISSVEPVCRSWDDFIFTHYNALLRSQFDNYLQKYYSQSAMAGTMANFGAFDAVQFHGDIGTVGKRLVEGMKTDPRTKKETLQPMKMLQGVLIAKQFGNFIYQQGLALSKYANISGISNLIRPTDEQPENEDINAYIALDDHDSLRVLTHMLLVFIGLGFDLGGGLRQEVIENIIVSYVSFLRLAGKEELIPLYCSQLSEGRKYTTLCRNLIDVTDHEQRVTQIRLMRELGLDVQTFVRCQSRFLFADYPDTRDGYPATGNFKIFEDGPSSLEMGRRIRSDFFGDDPDKVERVDMLFIRSLEWYLLVNGLWSETFYHGTLLYLRFFRHMHLTAARMLASKIPSSEIAKSKTRIVLGESLDFISLETDGDDDDLTEVLDGSAEQKKLLKKHMLAEAKNFRELESLIESLDHMETVTSMVQLLHENSEPKWQKGWRMQLARTLHPTRASVQPLFKGWLLSSQLGHPDFKLLREAYLPETILGYISTLQFAGFALTRDFLMECMELSAVIAAEDSDLVDLFVRTGRMPELVEAFALSSKALLVSTSAKKGTGSKSKKLRALGWTPELWNVKS